MESVWLCELHANCSINGSKGLGPWGVTHAGINATYGLHPTVNVQVGERGCGQVGRQSLPPWRTNFNFNLNLNFKFH